MTKDPKTKLKAVEVLPDDQIEAISLPEILDWSKAQRGILYRPVKQQITLRLNADIVTWFRTHAKGGRGYQTDINRALREHVQRCESEVTL